jgi:hypothetical protein
LGFQLLKSFLQSIFQLVGIDGLAARLLSLLCEQICAECADFHVFFTS